MGSAVSLELSTSDLSDEYGASAQICGAGFTQYGGRRRFAGPVVTIRCHLDNRLMRTILSEQGHGRVLVVDGGASLRRALLGDVSAALAARNGWAGIVINGAVRDADALRTLDVGVVALGTCPRRGDHTGAGERDVELEIDGARIVPGSYLVSDRDGIVCLAKAPVERLAPAGTEQDHPYRPAVLAGSVVHVSGALGVDRDGVAVLGRQTALAAAMDRLGERLGTVGADVGDLVKCTYYVTDVSLRAEANDQYRQLFPNNPPARTFVEVSALPYGAIVEIDGVALV
jgi:regulator of ribonuclease activity A